MDQMTLAPNKQHAKMFSLNCNNFIFVFKFKNGSNKPAADLLVEAIFFFFFLEVI